MAFAGTGKIWMNGSMVDWKDATIHVASHVIHYGTGAFEGLRAYDSKTGTNVFRLEPHMRRMIDSCRVYRMEPKWSQAELSRAVLDTVRINGFKSCYIRPVVFRGYDSLTLDPRPCPVEAAIIVWEWSQMMGAEALEKGIDVGVSSWTRLAPNTLPALAKGSANYANSALIKMQAMLDGYADAVALDESGLLSEGSGQNLFLVRDGVICTPTLASSVLQGLRDGPSLAGADHDLVERPHRRNLDGRAAEKRLVGQVEELARNRRFADLKAEVLGEHHHRVAGDARQHR